MLNKREYIINKMTDIRRNKTNALFSNIYGVPENIEEICESEKGIAYRIDDRGVDRVYLMSSELDDIPSLIEKFPSGSGIEILARELDTDVKNKLHKGGYEEFAVYLRASNTELIRTHDSAIPEKYQNVDYNKYVKQAEESQIDDIYNLLYETFNPMTSHLQTKEQIREQIGQNRIFVAVEDGKLATIMTYEIQGKKLYMEHAANRGHSVLMHSLYFHVLHTAAEKGINFAYTWMKEGNDRIFAFTKRYGIIPDGMKNYVYVKK